MESKITTVDEVTRQVAVTLPAEEVREAIDAAYRELNRRVKLQGFRKGRAPREMLENLYRHQVEQEVAEGLVGPALLEVVTSHGLEAVGRPRVEGANVRLGEPLSFTATVQVIPDFELRSLEGENFTKKVVRVTDEELEGQLARFAEQRASFEGSDEEPLAKGDYVVLDFERTDVGQETSASAVQSHPVILGEGGLHPVFEEQLLGACQGEVREVTIPPDEEVGEERRFRITVQEVKKRRVPPLDEAFALTVGEESLESLRATLRREMERFEELRATERLRADVSRRMVALHDIPVPDALMEEEVRRLMADLQRSMAASGHQLDTSEIRAEGFSERLKEPARERAISSIVLDRVAAVRSVEPSEGDIQTEVARLAHSLNREPAEVRKEMEDEGTIEGLRMELRRSSALDALVDELQITEEVVARKEVEDSAAE
ncbi:MAG: trigger factor [bacterium]|nr:trigger factor [bacterium]